MSDSTADQMIRGAAALLARVGLQGASFREVVRSTGAPRGSIYHHFPGGKADLVARAVQLVGQSVFDAIQNRAGEAPVDVVTGFAGMWRAALTRSDFGSGCAVAAVTVAADAELPELTALTGKVFGSWEAALAAAFSERSLEPTAAAELSSVVVAGVEGALILARAQRSTIPFDRVVVQLERLARSHTRGPEPAADRPHGEGTGTGRGGAAPASQAPTQARTASPG